MTTTVRDYLDEVERLFLFSPAVRSFQIREREERLHEGFIRIRAILNNDDVFEAFEFVVATPMPYRPGRIGCTGSRAMVDSSGAGTMLRIIETSRPFPIMCMLA